MSSIIEFIKSLMGDTRLPKSFRKTLDKEGNKFISSIQVVRVPLSGLAEGFMNLITAGKWKDIKANYDKIFHLYAIIKLKDGPNLLLEKNQTPVLYPHSKPIEKNAESINIPIPTPLSLGEFIKKTIDRVGLGTYTDYDGFRNNCQVFIKNHLLYNNLYTPQAVDFIYQDTKSLVERTPSFSQWLGKKITDVAAYADKAVQELIYKRGGIHRPSFPQGKLVKSKLHIIRLL
jgi:hypothetical protein